MREHTYNCVQAFLFVICNSRLSNRDRTHIMCKCKYLHGVQISASRIRTQTHIHIWLRAFTHTTVRRRKKWKMNVRSNGTIRSDHSHCMVRDVFFKRSSSFFSSICTWRATRCYAPFHLTALGMSAPFHFDSILTLE